MRASAWLGAYAVVCFSVSTMWAELRIASPLWLVLMLAILCPGFLNRKMAALPSDRLKPPRAWQTALGLLLVAPVAIYLASTMHQEFPFGGDQDHHYYMARALLNEFGWQLILVVAVAVGTLALARKVSWAPLLWLGGAYALSWRYEPSDHVLRYPAGLYFLAAPFNAIFSSSVDPLFANRLTNMLSVPVYLFVLRPYLVRRWPDFRAFLFGAFFLFQKDWIYYQTSGYLEPWCAALILLGLELCISDDDYAIELAPAVIGLGCMFKEQAVFTLLLVTAVFWQRKLKPWGLLRATAASVFFFLPFFVYYSARSHYGVWRKAGLENWKALFAKDLWSEYALHNHGSLHIGGELATVLLVGAALIATLILRKQILPLLALILFTGVEIFYLADAQSSIYPGYPRFHLSSWPLLAIPVFMLYSQTQEQQRKGLIAVVALGGLLQLAVSTSFFAQAWRSDLERNYIEQFHAPIYFPFRELLRHLPVDKSSGRDLFVNAPVDLSSYNYSLVRALDRDLRPFGRKQLLEKPLCACTYAAQTILLVDAYVPETGDQRLHFDSKLKPDELKLCAEEMRRSCAAVDTAMAPDGRTVGVIAYTPRAF